MDSEKPEPVRRRTLQIFGIGVLLYFVYINVEGSGHWRAQRATVTDMDFAAPSGIDWRFYMPGERRRMLFWYRYPYNGRMYSGGDSYTAKMTPAAWTEFLREYGVGKRVPISVDAEHPERSDMEIPSRTPVVDFILMMVLLLAVDRLDRARKSREDLQ